MKININTNSQSIREEVMNHAMTFMDSILIDDFAIEVSDGVEDGTYNLSFSACYLGNQCANVSFESVWEYGLESIFGLIEKTINYLPMD